MFFPLVISNKCIRALFLSWSALLPTLVTWYSSRHVSRFLAHQTRLLRRRHCIGNTTSTMVFNRCINPSLALVFNAGKKAKTNGFILPKTANNNKMATSAARLFIRQASEKKARSLSTILHHPQSGGITFVGKSQSPIQQQPRVLTIESSSCRFYSRTYNNHQSAATVPITYIEPDGTERLVDAEIGQNMMQVAHDNDIELEGACGGELACSTCHLIFEQDLYNTLPEKEDEEDDMLDLAFEVTETSRLGCQILVRENFAGTKVQIPDDGF